MNFEDNLELINLINAFSINTNIDFLIDNDFLIKSDNELINKFTKIHTNIFLYNLILNDDLFDIEQSLIKLSNNNQTMNYYEIIKNVHSFFFEDISCRLNMFKAYSGFYETLINDKLKLWIGLELNFTKDLVTFDSMINEISDYKKYVPGIDFNSNYEISQKNDDVQKYLYHFIPEINNFMKENKLTFKTDSLYLEGFVISENNIKKNISSISELIIDASDKLLISNTEELNNNFTKAENSEELPLVIQDKLLKVTSELLEEVNQLPLVTTSSEEVVNELSSEVIDLPLVTTSEEEVVHELSSEISDLPLVITSSEEVVNELSSEISEDNSELITEDIDSETSSESTNNTNNSWKNFFFNMFSFNYNPVNYINNFFLFTRGILRFFNFWS